MNEKKRYARLIFARTFRYLGAALVLCALVGGLYQDRLHFIWALCAAGALMVAWGWFLYLSLDETGFWARRKKKKSQVKAPYMLRRFREGSRHKPAFLQSSDEFDDDLTAQTLVDEEIFSEKQRDLARVVSRILAGALLFLISFFITP